MPGNNSYQSEVEKLNQELAQLHQQLQRKQFEADNYKQSLMQAQKQSSNRPQARDINPILKQIRNKNLSIKEKKDIMFPELYPSYPEDIFYQWVAPTRVTIHRDKQWYWTMGLLLMVMLAVAVLFRQMIWVAVILAFAFALYVNASIPAENAVYRLTRQGIEIGEGDAIEIFAWGQLLEYSYYFKNNTEVMYVETIVAMPQQLQILFSQEDRKNIAMIMEAHLPYKPVPKSQGRITRLMEGVYIPLNDFKALQEKIDQYYNSKYSEIIFQLKREGRIPQDVSVEDIRNAESIQTMKLLDQMQKQQEEEARRALGI